MLIKVTRTVLLWQQTLPWRPITIAINLTQARRNEFSIGAAVLSMKAKRAERLTAWGPGARSRAPGGVQGQSPGGGPGGSAPGSSWVSSFVKGPERLSWKYIFLKSTYIYMVQKCFSKLSTILENDWIILKQIV